MTQRQIDLWLTPESEADLMKAQVLKEKVYPADIARMALFLASDDSRLISAQDFVVDAEECDSVILSEAKDLASLQEQSCGVGVRSFAALRTTTGVA